MKSTLKEKTGFKSIQAASITFDALVSYYKLRIQEKVNVYGVAELSRRLKIATSHIPNILASGGILALKRMAERLESIR